MAAVGRDPFRTVTHGGGGGYTVTPLVHSMECGRICSLSDLELKSASLEPRRPSTQAFIVSNKAGPSGFHPGQLGT